nr:hypothetical protein [Clostridiales bacterium]
MKSARISALALAFILMLGVFAACGDSGADAPSGKPAETQAALEEQETEPEDPLPSADYGGYEFRILNNISNFAYTNIGEEG